MQKPSKLFNKNFVLLWQGQLVSQLGNQAYAIAMMFWIKHETGSATLMGLIMMISQLPAVIFGPIGGTYADRHSRKLIIVISDLLNGFIVMCLAAILFFMPDNTELIIVFLFIVALISSTISAYFRPAVSAAIPDLVPSDKLQSANSLNQLSVQASTFLGQGIGGVLYRILGAKLLFLFDSITYFASAISEMFISIPQKLKKDSDNKTSYWADVKEGFFFIKKNKGMKNLFFAAAFINFFLVPGIVLLPFYVEDTLLLTTDWYGYLIASFGAGAILGYLLTGTINLSGNLRSRFIIYSMIIMSALLGVLGFINNQYLALLNFFLIGLLNGFININIVTILQLTTPSEIRGRVFGALNTIAGGIAPIAMGLSGIIADLLNQNIPLILILSGGISTLLCILIAFNSDYRKFLAYEPESSS